ncbi:hypothetical protein [Ktedonospora formicarum]|uniref:hypothetical protein n=1 Tax=Ktedonospora formicarum TaxID=2778364 RepID=UPI001C68D5D5|nr:hypothetical protein [Ktedonospora formicarum]
MPVLPDVLSLVTATFTPPLVWLAIVTGACFVLTLLWSGYHLWKWYRFERFFRVL